MEYNISIEISNTKEICDRVDFIRRQNNFNQEQLALKLSISQPAVSKYLNSRIPPADILFKLAQLGGTTIEWILTGKNSHSSNSALLKVQDKESNYGSNPHLLLAQKIGRLNPKARQAIKSLIEML